MKFLLGNIFYCVGDNDNQALIPEAWANESLAILEENMVIGNLVHRDFENDIAEFGETVNTRRPAEFKAKRKSNADSVTIQDASATNVEVKLNQWIHTSFMIKDGEQSKAFKDLARFYAAPAILSQARMVDQILLGQYVRFLSTVGGGLRKLSSTTAKDFILDLRTRMDMNKCYDMGRNMIVNPFSEAEILKDLTFLEADKVGDQGTALRTASLGQKLGFNFFKCQNMSVVNTGNTVKSGTISNSGGYAIGTTVMTVTGITGAVATGSWVTIDTDDTPYRISAHTETLGNTTSITIAGSGLRKAVANGVAVVAYTPGAVNLVAGYAAGYDKEIVIDGFTVAPQIGQLVSFTTSTTSALYTIIDVTSTTGITLDRPLEAALADNDAVNIGPAGFYNFAFHRNALCLVSRPLARPPQGVGASSAVINHKGLSMRATLTYNGEKQGLLVTLDMLLGVQVLDTKLGGILLG